MGILAVGFIIPFLFLLPATVIVVLRVLRKSPLELMRGSVGSTNVGWLEKRLKLDRLPFQRKFQIRELARNIPRSLLMVLGVTFASMLFLFGFVTKDSMDQLIQGNYQQTIKYEYEYTFSTLQTSPPPGGERMALASFTSPRDADGNKAFAIYGMQPDASLIQLEDASGKQLTFDQVIMTKTLADTMGIKEGDTVQVRNEWNAKTFEIKVDQVADTYIGDIIYMPIAKFNQQNGLPEGSYLQLVSANKLNLNQGALLSTQSRQDLLDGYRNLIKPMQEMIGMIAIVAFIIGLIVIHVIFSMTVEESRAKVSLLKVLGYRKQEIFKLVLGFNKWLVLLGYLLSIPLILLSLKQMFNALTTEMGLHFPITIQWRNLIIVFVLVCLTYFCSIWLNRNKMDRIPMDETLKSMRE